MRPTVGSLEESTTEMFQKQQKRGRKKPIIPHSMGLPFSVHSENILTF